MTLREDVEGSLDLKLQRGMRVLELRTGRVDEACFCYECLMTEKGDASEDVGE